MAPMFLRQADSLRKLALRKLALLNLALGMLMACGSDDGGGDKPPPDGSVIADGGEGMPDASTGDASGSDANQPPLPVQCESGQMHCNGVCLGGEGESREACTLVVLGSRDRGVFSMRSTERELLYGMDEGSLMALDHAADRARSVSKVDDRFVRAAVPVGPDVYFVAGSTFDDGTLYKAPLAGGDATLVSERLFSVDQLEASGSTLYFLPSGPVGRTVHTIPLAGGEAVNTRVKAVCNMQLDKTALYTADGVLDYQLQRRPLNDLATATDLIKLGSLCTLAQDADHVYWERRLPDRLGFYIERMPKVSGAATQVVRRDQGAVAAGPVVDGGYVYWMELENDVLRRAPVAGGSIEELARIGTGDNGSILLAVHGGAAYVAVRGSLLRVRFD